MEIEKAFKRLLISSPFYGLFCLSLPKVITRNVDTLCIAKRGISIELWINPDFWEYDPHMEHHHTDDEQVALLQHEIGHIINKHMFLHDSFMNQDAFNCAADMEVNSYIENLPESALRASKIGMSDGLGVKAYYEKLTQQQNQQNQQAQQQQNQQQQSSPPTPQGNESQQEPQQPQEQKPEDEEKKDKEEQKQNPQDEDTQQGEDEQQNDGSSDGNGKPQEEQPKGDGRNTIDNHSTWKDFKDAPEAAQQLIENQLNSIIKSVAEQVEKSCGKVPAEFSEIVKKLKEKKPEIFNWKAYFRRILGTIYDINIKSTRRKESKRFAGAAGIQHKKKVSVLVAVDTSGSVSTKELQEFFNEIDYIYKAGARITIVECDAEINSVVEYDGKNIPEIKGRGGTSFAPPIDYYIKSKKDYASLIYFTDGYCSLPEKRPSNVIWVITSNGNQNQEYFGKTIFIPKENENNGK